MVEHKPAPTRRAVAGAIRVIGFAAGALAVAVAGAGALRAEGDAVEAQTASGERSAPLVETVFEPGGGVSRHAPAAAACPRRPDA